MRTIEAVAIRYRGKLYTLPKPNRHHHVIHLIAKETGEDMERSDQGFLDNEGKFVGRKEACKIATRAGQLNIVHPKTSPKDVLFSEDVW